MVLHWHKERQIKQWYRIESRKRPGYMITLILDKGTKMIQQEKESFSNKCCWNNWRSICGVWGGEPQTPISYHTRK